MMALTQQALPNDINALKSLLLQSHQRLEKSHQQLEKSHTTLTDVTEKHKNALSHIALLEEQVRYLTGQRFGTSSEKNDRQAELFNESEHEDLEANSEAEHLAQSLDIDTAEDQPDNAEIGNTPAPQAHKKAGRKPLPKSLPRIRIEHDLTEAEKICDCGCALTPMGSDTSEQLDIIPAKIQVLQHVRLRYACKACEDTVKIAPLPPQPLPKSNASPGLLATIVTAKYQDSLPLYRQEVIFKRHGVHLPRNTTANWVMRCAKLIKPVITELDAQLRASPYLHCDETPVQVLKEPNKPATSQSYMWVRANGDRHQPIVLYDYSPSRAGRVAASLLEGFAGYLHTDDYAGYHAIGKHAQVTPLGCWAHARRKFVTAKKVNGAPAQKPTVSKADMAINYIAKLYAVEKEANDLSDDARYALRQEKSVPVLNALRQWLDKTLENILPKGYLGKALGYLHKNWEKLVVYTTDGQLAIDNNRAENAIRPFVVGRKNWLFSDTTRGAHASASLYGLIETAKANGLEPYAYLKYLFAELPTANTSELLQALLPWNVDCDLLSGVA